MAASVRLTPYIHSYPNAGNDHETTQSCEPDDGLSPKDGVLPQPGEVYPSGEWHPAMPRSVRFCWRTARPHRFVNSDRAVSRHRRQSIFYKWAFLFQFSEGNPLVQRVEGVDTGNGRRTPQSCCPVQVFTVQRGS